MRNARITAMFPNFSQMRPFGPAMVGRSSLFPSLPSSLRLCALASLRFFPFLSLPSLLLPSLLHSSDGWTYTEESVFIFAG